MNEKERYFELRVEYIIYTVLFLEEWAHDE